MTRAICVIGGSGFVGSALRQALRVEGREVIVVGRSPSFVCATNETYLSRANYDAEALENQLAARRVSVIIDLSYASAPNARKADLLGDVSSNLAGLIHNLDLACRLQVDSFLFVSSGGAVYGDVGDMPIAEGQVTEPISSYGIAKLACERVVHLYHRTRDLPSIVVRPSNVYGPGQVPFTGQGIVATALASGATGVPVTVFGDGQSVRDYLFNEDCGAGIIALINSGRPGQTYNLGTGIGLTTNALLAAVAKILDGNGHTLELRHVAANTAAIAYNVLDVTKITTETGWHPRTSFVRGLEQTWSWVKSIVP